MDLDAMFEDMLGDLAQISQQLEGTTKTETDGKPAKHTPSVIPASTITSDTIIDADLNAMLNDLTDLEQNLVAPGAPSSSSGSKASVGDDYQQNVGDLQSTNSSEMLHATYGMDYSPQVSTLKRSAAGARTVTYEDEDTLEDLAKDIEIDKRNQDKARQMSAEELATLSPVLQELDDLVNDLSNLGFFETSDSNQDVFSSTSQNKPKTPTIANNTFEFSKQQPERTGSLPKRRPSVPESSSIIGVRRNSAKDNFPPKSSNDTTQPVLRQSLEDLRKSKPVSNKPKPPPKPPVSSKPHVQKKPQEYPPKPLKPKPASPPQTITRQESEKGAEVFPPPPPIQRQGSANALQNFSPPSPQQEYPPRPPKPKPPSPSQTISRQGSAKRPENFSLSHSIQRQGSAKVFENFPPPPFQRQGSAKTPEVGTPPPIFQRQGSAKTPEAGTPPPLFQRHGSIKAFENSSSSPIKRQGSAKAPENLLNILERQLQQRAAQNERRASRTSTSSEANSESVPDHHNHSFNHHSHQHHNVTEVTPHPVPISKHSSMASVVSSISASSATSAKSDSSVESGSMEHTHYNADHANDRPVPDDIRNLMNTLQHNQKGKDISPEEREERIKTEKMRIALEKLKEARIQKLVVKVFNKDDSSKTLLVDERMTARAVISQLLEKNHSDPSVNWALVEELPSLYMERIFEEHECVTEMLSYWTRDTSNQVRFLERKDKYALFRNPQHYLLSVSDSEKQLAERQKQTLIDEFFSGRSGTGVPEVQGVLYIKAESKSWTKKYCVLRSSGLYFSKSGEPKKGKKLADLQCLVMFEHVCVYLGRGWKKKYKSPTDYGFSLKHPAIQTKSKHIKYFCCDDVRSLMRWIVGIRCAKYGKQLKDNYDRTDAEMKAQGITTLIPTVQTQKEVSANSEPPDGPRSSITNVFGGAWQRANQEETQNTGGEITRTKSVWSSSNTKSTSSSSNWWDLGAGPELKDLAQETLAGGQRKHSFHSDLPPPPPASSTNPPRPGPPPPRTNPSRPGPPPLPSKKPTTTTYDNNRFPPPPPPADDVPPPPPLDDMPPPPPPMDDMPPPPPPIDEEMPLPPPMPVAGGHRAPPRFSGNPGDPPPVRLPMLPMFKNGNNLSKQQPPKRPGPPPPSRNYNASNNKVAYQPEVAGNMRHKAQPTSPPRPPLTAYYTNTIKSSTAIPFAASDLPPAPEFVSDLKDTFYSMSNGLGHGVDSLDDFPPPPPELLLNELKSRKNQQYVNKKNMKSAPPPPRRSASTKLSFKRA